VSRDRSLRRHELAIGDLPMDVGVKIRESGPEDFVDLSRAILMRRHRERVEI
jgi:hypothetical protein